MMYSNKGKRYKRKEMALTGLYLAVLLATVGEFFYAFNTQNQVEKKETKVEKQFEIPPHIPEDAKIEFVRYIKIRERMTGKS